MWLTQQLQNSKSYFATEKNNSSAISRWPFEWPHATGYPSCEVKRLLYQGLYINILGDPGADSGVEGRLDFPLPLLSVPGSPRMIRSQPILILSKRQEHINVSH